MRTDTYGPSPSQLSNYLCSQHLHEPLPPLRTIPFLIVLPPRLFLLRRYEERPCQQHSRRNGLTASSSNLRTSALLSLPSLFRLIAIAVEPRTSTSHLQCSQFLIMHSAIVTLLVRHRSRPKRKRRKLVWDIANTGYAGYRDTRGAFVCRFLDTL